MLQGVDRQGKRVMSTNDTDQSQEQRLTTGTPDCQINVPGQQRCQFIRFTHKPCGFL